jgi:DNA-directed RNA polymerase subunit L
MSYNTESEKSTSESSLTKTMDWANNIVSNMALTPIEETDVTIRFTLAGINVSLANAIRRTIQDDIPVYVFNINKCTIDINTGRLHNEILKHRLQCIPIHSKVSVNDWLQENPDHNIFDKYVMELDVQNEGEQTMYVTTADFRVKNKTNGRQLTSAEMERLFPRDKLTNSHIIFARLRPRISDTIPGEQLKLSCEFAISNAAENSAFTAVCCSVYGNTIDVDAANKAWETAELRIRDDAVKRNETVDADELAFEKKNFQILDRQRYYEKDSFDFNIESVGIYEPRELCKMACAILKYQFDALAESIESDNAVILKSETTLENAFDFILDHGDYTIGKALELVLYEKGFVAKGGSPTMNFCGFKKMHPHDDHAIIRVGYIDKSSDQNWFKNDLKQSCAELSFIFKSLSTKF